MLQYSIVIRKKALKEISTLNKPVKLAIVSAIDQLAKVPFPKGVKKLKGMKEYLWRLRVGDYRIIYSVEEQIRIIDVRKIGHRKDIYKGR